MKSLTIIQGETFTHTLNFNDYPTPPWSASMNLTNENKVYSIEGVGVGTRQDFRASPEETKEMEAGDYKVRVAVTDGTDIFTAYTTRAQVKLDPTVPGTDMSHVEKVLKALQATIEGRAGSDILNYSIRGRSIGRMSPQELLGRRDKYLQFWKEEQHEEDISNGLPGERGIIRVRL